MRSLCDSFCATHNETLRVLILAPFIFAAGCAAVAVACGFT